MSNRNKCCIEISLAYGYKVAAEGRTETSVVLKLKLLKITKYDTIKSNRNKCCIEILRVTRFLALSGGRTETSVVLK